MKKTINILYLNLLLFVGGVQGAHPVSKGLAPMPFTYQGQLTDNNSLPTNTYDFEFLLFNAASAGVQVGSTLTKQDVPVTDGIFQVELDFITSFDNGDYWLEVHVRPGNSTGPYTTLSPRQYITFAPKAIFAINATTADAAFSADIASAGPFWYLSGNSGPGNFLGTRDANALELRTNNKRVGLFSDATDLPNQHAPNILMGSEDNIITSSLGATISGGGGDATNSNCGDGTQLCVNTVSADYGTVSGGFGNFASSRLATVGGGVNNIASGNSAVVSGGSNNIASNVSATIAGGFGNNANGQSGFVGGGSGNTASGFAATVPGGSSNLAGGDYSFAAGSGARIRDADTVNTDAGITTDTNGDEGTFVWADASGGFFSSTGPNQFLVRASGGAVFTDDNTQNSPLSSQVLIDSALAYPLRVRADGATTLTVTNQQRVGVGTFIPENAFHVIDSITGGAVDTHVAQIQNTNLGTGADGLAIVLGTTLNPGTGNNFISFYTSGGNTLVGQIEGNGTGGVSYNTSGGDFAEYLPSNETDLQPGEVVGLVQGRLSRETGQAERVLVISGSAAFVGATPLENKTGEYALAAFMGQVPVRLHGEARSGDWLVASGKNDGHAVARGLEQLQAADMARIIGRALEASRDGQVKALVGLPPQALLAAQQQRLSQLEGENRLQQQQLAQQQQQLIAMEANYGQQLAQLQQALQALQASQQQLVTRLRAAEGDAHTQEPAQ